MESNHLPLACQASALPVSYGPWALGTPKKKNEKKVEEDGASGTRTRAPSVCQTDALPN